MSEKGGGERKEKEKVGGKWVGMQRARETKTIDR